MLWARYHETIFPITMFSATADELVIYENGREHPRYIKAASAKDVLDAIQRKIEDGAHIIDLNDLIPGEATPASMAGTALN